MARGQVYLQPTGSRFDQHNTYVPGRYFDTKVVGASTIVNFTGSNFGYAAFLIENATGVEITASNGVGMASAAFNTKEIYDIGLRRIKTGASGKVYAFRRQQ
jgi:hypothetical protein